MNLFSKPRPVQGSTYRYEYEQSSMILESILQLQVAVSGSLKTAPTGTRDELNGHLYKVPVLYRYLVQILDWSIYVVR